MKQINIREALLELDRKTDARYDLTTLYEACKLDDDDKQKLVKYIDAYDHPATINKFLSSKCDAITEALGDDDVSDMKIIDEINDGGDQTLWSLMNKFEDEDLQLKELTEDVDPEVLQSRLEDIEYAMNTYAKDSFFIDNVEGSGTDWKVTYNGTTVDVVFDTEWDEYTYTINGKGPYSHSSYEYITKDIMDFVDYGHLGQSDDEVDEALGDNRDVHSRTHMDSYDVYCTDCGQVTSHKFKGNFKDGEKELGRYICKECGCENDDDPINESLTEDVDTSNLEPQIKEVVNAFMAEVGYEADEIEAYTAVEIKDTADDMVQVEVRAELGYDDLMELCDKLNPIVAAVDHLAYFEPVTSGIARAFIRNDQSQDIVDEEAVNQWTNKIYDCASMDDLRQVWRHFHDQMDNGQYTDGTVDAVLDVIHKKADMLNESLTEDATEEYYVGDSEGGRIYHNDKDAQAALDSLKKSGVTDAVKMKVTDMREGLTESYNKGEWVEVNLNTKKNGTPNIIPVKVDSGHGKTFLGWAWGERQHEYPMSAIVKKIDMDDTDAIIRKYTPSGYMGEKLTLNESDDTDILYDMEDYDDDNTTVSMGNSFIEDGYTWTWFKQCGDTVHLDFDNWAVWWAYRPEVEDDENSTAISGFFVVDTDTGFIDWGPCDTVKEAQEFLQSKVNDWENDDIDESKSIKEDADDNITNSYKWDTEWELSFNRKIFKSSYEELDNLKKTLGCTSMPYIHYAPSNRIKTPNYVVGTIYKDNGSTFWVYIEDYLSEDNFNASDYDDYTELDTHYFKTLEDAKAYVEEWFNTEFEGYTNSVQDYTNKSKSSQSSDLNTEHLYDKLLDLGMKAVFGFKETHIESEIQDRAENAGMNRNDAYKFAREIISHMYDKHFEFEDDIDESIKESGISEVEPVVKFKGKSSHTFTPDKKWEVDFDEEGNVLARTRQGKPYYFSGHINDKTNEFGHTDEDAIIQAAREQHKLKFGKLTSRKNESKSIKEDVNSAANSLFDLLKDYGAISVDKDVDVTRITFRNSEDDSDATLVHHCILSKGYKELNQYGNNPNVTEYMNEAGDTCVKLLIYDDSIAVELSAEDSSQYMNVDESLKEGVEKYIIIAKEDGLNLYYNATDDNFGTDMKAATQYEERAVALDDYKAVKDRYPTAYIRSTYDIPLLNKPSKKEGFEEDEWDDNELASIYGGDTKYDIPDGVETPEETEARLAKESALKESTKYVVIKADGTYAGIPCESEEEARELSNQHEGSKVHKIEG